MTKVLVTGGAGYIGSNVCNLLIKAGHQVKVYDDFSNGKRERLKGMRVEVVHGDILNRSLLIDAMDSIDCVIHLAAKKSVEESVENPLKYYENNFSGTLNVLAAMSINKVKKIVFSSTAVVYDSTSKDSLSEDDCKNPLSPYASTKLLGEELIGLTFKSEGISSISLRYFNVVGAGGPTLGDNSKDNLVPKTFKALLENRTPEIYGNDYNTNDGTCIRDYVHVVDLAKAHLVSLESLEKKCGASVFNIGSGTGYSVSEMMNQMKLSTGINFEARIMPRRPGDPERLVADISKIQNELGWKPIATLKEMIDSSWAAESSNS
jgi:UDP-glucose 4-epimerase